ncbi:MAG: hypothetical protein CVU78_08000 [Elusimicrobia bacterium HGW-Elusimicrobia-2]|nr:MAG: hypothetical protein CVU78_08000 [Elusimicrobia bacterium HGW-Elusimicrobia-2]
MRSELTVATAGAGTGKTTYLVSEFLDKVDLLKGEGKSLKDALGCVLAVTFSRKAAGEMKKRIIEKLGEPRMMPFLNISTIDAFCADILRENPAAAGIDSKFEILSGGSEHIFFRKAIDKARNTITMEPVSPIDLRSAKELYDFITHLRLRLIRPDDLADFRWEGEGNFIPFIRLLYKIFEGNMKERSALDFPQILLEAYRLLDGHKNVRDALREKYRFVFIDEFQDTSPVQMELFMKIDPQRLCVVGDFNQSIYSFRGATPENLTGIKEKADKTKSLSTNYRSVKSVLDFANLIEGKLKDYHLLSPRPDAPAGEKVCIVTAENRRQEALYIASQIKRLKKEQGLKNSDFAVILRSMKTAISDYEKVFRDEGIDFLSASGGGFYDRAEIKQIVAILKFLAAPGDDSAFFEFLTSPMVAFTLEDIYSFGAKRKRGVSLFEAFLDAGDRPGKDKRARVDFFLKNRKFPGRVSIHRYIMVIILDCGLTEWVKADFDGVYRLRALANIKKFLELALNYEKTSPAPSLSEFLEYIGGPDKHSSGAVESDAALDSSDCVDIMTVHKIKGLERKVVFVANITPSQFPIRDRLSMPWEITGGTIRRAEKEKKPKNVEPKIADEEWRLFYVAMTRAKERLYLLGRPSKGKLSPLLSFFLDGEGDRFSLKEQFSPLAVHCRAEGVFEDKGKTKKKMIPVFRSHGACEYFSEETVIETKIKKGFSVSEISGYHFCPLRYRNDYILKKTGSVSEDHIKTGNVLHTAIEHFDKSRGDDFFRQSVRESLLPHLIASAGVMADNFLSSAFSAPPFMRESTFILKFKDTYIKGAIDRVEKKKDSYEIYDYKTGKKADASPYALPMNIYALGCKCVFGLKPVSKLGLFFLSTGKIVDAGIMEEAALLKTLDKIVGGIRSRDFRPRPGEHCRACPYSEKCEAAKKDDRASV